MDAFTEKISFTGEPQSGKREEADRQALTHQRVDVAELVSLVRGARGLIFDDRAVSDIHVKGAADFVTRVDMEVQDYLQRELSLRYPGIGFVAEEQGSVKADPDGTCWILDPIDGTTNLIHHYQMSAVSLGLYEGGEITLGIVYNPFSEELYTAAAGQGAYRNGIRIRVSDTACLEESLLSYGSNPYDKAGAHALFALYERIFTACSDFRRSGSAALDLCYVACGRLDAFLEPNLKPWDYAAGTAILREAGGKIGTWKEGEALKHLKNNDIFATNGKIEAGLYKLVKAGVA